ncbi:RNA 3'-phosphate cyclase [Candidatus Woesearchaeota archaeon]|nr:MAG: RNA 3'-phosphate cyclase [Candidatus Woesearchaeota archaeon]
MATPLVLDGSSGGGQILRYALAFSTLTGQPFILKNIRASRPNPGLQPQHLASINAMVDWTGAACEGAEIGSSEIFFQPGIPKSGTFTIDIKTAGSVTLLMQSLLLPAVFGEGHVRFIVRGGTDVQWSMPWDYFAKVVIPHYTRLAEIDLSLIKRGYYPRGGGEAAVRITPKYPGVAGTTPNEIAAVLSDLRRNPLDISEQGILHIIRGISHASADLQQRQVAERQARAASHLLLKYLDRKSAVPVRVEATYQETLSTGSGITLWASFSDSPDDINLANPVVLGADTLGRRDLSAEQVGEAAASKLIDSLESLAPVDVNLADNLVPLLSVFGGRIRVQAVSSHTALCLSLAQEFLDFTGIKIRSEGNLLIGGFSP